VEDEGEGFDPAHVPDPTLDENIEASSGRGIALMRAAMDSVEYNEKGNVVTLIKASPWKLEGSLLRGQEQPEA
jgi:serine/threonine-protein kinase RsbW